MALRELAEERVSLELVTPTPEFAYRPLAVAEPFGLGNVRRYDVVRMAADHGAGVHIGSVKSVDTETRQILTWEGRGLPYDLALIAIGARAATSIPGSVTLQGPGYTGRFRALLRDLEELRVRHVAFAVPPGSSWPLPLYELALMTATHAAERGLGEIRLSLVTPERQPLELFGDKRRRRSASCSTSAESSSTHRATRSLRGRAAVADSERDSCGGTSSEPAEPAGPAARRAASRSRRLHPGRPPRARAGEGMSTPPEMPPIRRSSKAA